MDNRRIASELVGLAERIARRNSRYEVHGPYWDEEWEVWIVEYRDSMSRTFSRGPEVKEFGKNQKQKAISFAKELRESTLD